jgi:paraquat-inducible protein A
MTPTLAPTAPRPALAADEAAALQPRPDLVICEECDAVHQRVALEPGQTAHCQRCEALLGRGHRVSLNGLLAFAVASLLFFLIGNATPLVSISVRGVANAISLPEALWHTWQAGQPLSAMLAAATALVFPLMVIVLRLYLLVPMSRGQLPPRFMQAMRLVRFATRWNMVEVFMLGALIAVVRSAGLASVVPGPALFAYGALTLLLTSSSAAGLHRLWQLGDELQGMRR